MRRWVVALVCLLGLMPVIASAQDAGTAVAAPVAVYNGSGQEVAQVTITEMVDPFEDWAQYMDPQVGERYVVVTVEITNTGDRPFQYGSFDFSMLDTLGRLYSNGYDYRSEVVVAAVPPLEDASMLPGESVTGALTFTVPADAEVAHLVFQYRPDDTTMYSYQHLYLIGNFTGSATPAA